MKKHDDHLKEGDIFVLPVEQAHPTQFCVGLVSAECKRRTIEEYAEKNGEIESFMCQEGHMVPVVVGPPGRTLYLTDHHHLSTALWRAELPKEIEKKLFGYVIHDWSNESFDTFWDLMINKNLTWLYDQKGRGPLHPRLLPHTVGDILNDPFRTLSRWIRDAGCYFKDENKDKDKPICHDEKFIPPGKNTAFFIEFRWANFLRENVHIDLDPEVSYRTCDAMPYSSLCFQDEVKILEEALPQVIRLIGCHQLNNVSYDKHGCLKAKD